MPRRRKRIEQPPQEKPGVSRRDFLKGAGLTAAGTAMLETGLGSLAIARESAPVLGPGPVPVELRVNGLRKILMIEPRATLAEALRDSLDMTGTKVVCDRGACSACTVWVDDVPVNACMTFVMDVRGRDITTIEGLAGEQRLHPVQEAFIEHDATQCGYCTPGMVMSCAALLARNPSPTLDDVREAVSGNLCRCGTYPKVFEATLSAARAGGGRAEGEK